MKKTYPSDLTDSQWNHIKTFFEKTEPTRGKPQEIALRRIVNACLYILVTGCQWRYLPKDFPAWEAVYYHFRKWRNNGLWKQIHDRVRAAARVKVGRHKHPTAGSLDSQSVKNSCVAGEEHGFDAGKKTKGRKRHIVVDTLGFLLAIIARISERSRPRWSKTFTCKAGRFSQETEKDMGGRRLSRSIVRMG